MAPRKKVPAVRKNAPVENTSLLQIIGRAAMDPAVDIDKMNGLLDMQERILAGEARQQFAAAFPKMQVDLPIIKERGQVANRYSYAKWEDINAAILPVLSKHGFGIGFETSNTEDKVTVVCIVTHEAGHERRSELTLPLDQSGSKNVVQSAGSSTSYGKRYTAMALLNLQTTLNEDDDGSAGGTKTITPDDFELLNTRLDKDGVDKAAFCRRYRINSVADLPANKLALAFTELDVRKEKLESKENENE
jgi:hypothetical protein